MPADREVQNSSNQSLRKLAVAARVLGKELRRLKLKRVDLRRADLRLGEKAYAAGIADGRAELVSRLDAVAQRVTQLRQQQVAVPSTFGEKAKVFANRIARAVHLGALRLKRRRLLRQFGANLRQSNANSSLAEETQVARGVADRLSSIETEIRQLRPQTYRWASQPLLITCLLLLLAAVGAFALRHKPTPVLAQQRGAAGRSSLSDEQMNKIVAQHQTFQQQMQQMVAEATRRETEQRQARIAAAEREYKEEAERRKTEQENKAREEARKEEEARKQEAQRLAAENARREEEERVATARAQKEAALREEQEKKRLAAEQAQREEEQQREEIRRRESQQKSVVVPVKADDKTNPDESDELSFDSLLALQRRYLIEQPEAPFNKEPFSEAQRTLAGEKARFDSMIAQTRRRFWETYPDKPGFEEARAEFSHMLWEKDIYYLYWRWAPGRETDWEQLINVMAGGPVDGGIVPPARAAFDEWAKAFREYMVQKHWDTVADIFAIRKLTWQALGATYKVYHRYTTIRDFAEFDRAHREPAGFDDPRLYGVLLCMRSEQVSWLDAANEYAAMAQALGKQIVRETIEKIRAAPKNALGRIATAESVGVTLMKVKTWKDERGQTVEDRKTTAPEGAVVVANLDPVQVAVHLMMQTDARRYFLGCLAVESPDLETRRIREKIQASYDWPYAMKRYQQWVNCYGEQAVLAASDKVRTAIKRVFDGYVADPTAIGSIRGRPSSAIEDLLSNDTKGYVRAIVSYHLKHPAADVLDSAYKDLVSRYQEERVLAAARQVAEEGKKGSFPSYDYEGLIKILGGSPEPSPAITVGQNQPTAAPSASASAAQAGTPPPARPVRTIVSFSSKTGIHPRAPLVQGSDGNFYGTTSEEPAAPNAREQMGRGTVFKLSPDGVLTTLHVFHNTDGAVPDGGLVRGRDGNFYGTTSENGAPQKGAKHTTSFGTVFKITPSGTLTTLHYFGEFPDGQHPVGELVQGRDGNFYGVTQNGGNQMSEHDWRGTIFKVTPSGSLTILHRFTEANNEGGRPCAGLVEGRDGNFYGTTSMGGLRPPGRQWGEGTVFKITPGGEFSTLYTFPQNPPGHPSTADGDGQTPMCRLVEGPDGELYGTTKGGGSWPGSGTIFKITPTGKLTILYRFRIDRANDASSPESGLLRAKDGNFYGTTFQQNTIFRFSPTGTLTPLYALRREFVQQRNFGMGQSAINDKAKWAEQELAAGRDHPENTDGSILTTPLIEAADGTLWGTTEQGGIWNLGTVFKIDPKAFKELAAATSTSASSESSASPGTEKAIAQSSGRPQPSLSPSASPSATPQQADTSAVAKLRQAADAGDIGAMVKLGNLYSKGKGVAKDLSEAARWYRKAADLGHTEAMVELGNAYHNGEGVGKDLNETFRWNRKAAEAGNSVGMLDVGILYDRGEGVAKDPAEAVRWYRKAADLGHPSAMFLLGNSYHMGIGVEKNVNEAFLWYRKAAETGNTEGMFFVAGLYANGEGVAKDLSEAARWYRKAADAGDVRAMAKLGYFYHSGEGVVKDSAEAARWFRKVADAGNANAMLILGILYYNGDGVAKDLSEAARWYRKAAEAGDTDAMAKLGNAYFEGAGVAKDLSEAARWYRKAADAGNAAAMFLLGTFYSEGLGVAKDLSEAARWYRKAADAGNTMAMVNLGNFYYRGEGVAKDLSEAMRWYRKAADAGDAGAMLNLGNAYYKGEGVAQDLSEAVRWYRKAADAGNTNAMVRLGSAYSKGDGVAKDLSEAGRWYRKAADAGNANARVILESDERLKKLKADEQQALEDLKKLWDNTLVLSDGRHVIVDDKGGEFYPITSITDPARVKLTGADKEEAKRLLEERQQKHEQASQNLKKAWDNMLVLSDGRHVAVGKNDEFVAYKSMTDLSDPVKLTGAAKEEAKRLLEEYRQKRQRNP